MASRDPSWQARTDIARAMTKDDSEPHDMHPEQIRQLHERAAELGVAGDAANIRMNRGALESLLPRGMALDKPNRRWAQVIPGTSMGAMGPGGGGGSTFFTAMRPYQPEQEPDRQCFVEGTPILMFDGSKKNIEDVRAGDEVLGPDGRASIVVRQWCEGTPDELVEIRAWGGNDATYTCTTNHEWPAWVWVRECLCGCGEAVAPGRVYINHHHTKIGGPNLRVVGGTKRHLSRVPEGYEATRKIEAKDLRVGDCLLIPRKFDEVATDVPAWKARLLGYYAAEGSVDVHTTKFALHSREIDTLARDIIECCKLAGVDTYIYEELSCNGISVRTRGDTRYGEGLAGELTHWLVANAGKGSSTKTLSTDVMRWPTQLKLEFLRGYIAGDGSQRWKWCARGGWGFEVGFISTSDVMGRQVARMLVQCGHPGRMCWRPPYVGRDGSPRLGAWGFEIGGAHARTLADWVWQSQSKSREHEVVKVHQGLRMDDDFVYIPIRAITRRQNVDRQVVYNISVASADHLYCLGSGQSILTANCFPVHRRLANSFWRLFYKMDPIIGSVIDMFADLPWSDFQLTGEGVDGEIKETMDHMVKETKLRSMLPYFVREYFIIGEVLPHLYFDDAKGIWTYIALHNPDQINVVHTPFVKMDPIVEFVPDPKLREVITSNHPMLARVRESMPSDLVSALQAGQNIPLSPVNATFIPRKLHPYDLRGTSIISRLWRTLMLEDAIWAATIATARRAACFVAGTPVLTVEGIKPIEDVKIGDRIVAGNGSTETVEQAWAEMPDGDGLVEIKALGTQPLLCTPQHRFPVWATPRTCACGCNTPVEATYEGSGRAKRRAFINGHHLRMLRDAHTGRMRGGADVGWKIYSTEPKVRAPETYEPLQTLDAKDLRTGDYLLIPRRFDALETSTTPEAARLLGYFAAEGARRDVTSRGATTTTCEGAQFTFSLAESETWAPDVLACAASLGATARLHRYVPSAGTKTALSGREGTTNVYLQKQVDEHLASWLKENAGVGAGHHRLSEAAMRWPTQLKEELVRGYFRGDGHLGFPDAESPQCPQVTATSTSQTLIYQMRLILAQLGYFGSVSYNPKGDKPGEENWSDCWILSSTGRDARALAKLVWGVEITAPPREGKGSHSGGAARTWKDENYVYVPVQSVTRCADNITTYNLTVSGDHSYVSAGVATMNSPLKVAKLGDASSSTMVPPGEERRVQQMLAQAEFDPQCFTPETPVILGDGTRRCIGDLSIGDVVLDMHGQPSEVLALQTEQAKELIRIECVGVDEIECTTTHKWPVMRRTRKQVTKESGRRVWEHVYDFHTSLTADEIQRGDFLLMPRKFKERRPVDVTTDHARLLGYYVAEGSMRLVYKRADNSERWGFELSLCADEKDTIRKDVDEILTRLCGTTANLYEGDRNNLQVRVNKNATSDLALWLKRHGGEGATTKRLSADVLQWPLDLKYEFIKGYLAGDGCSVATKPRIDDVRYLEVGSASIDLINQVQLIFVQLGCLAKVNHRVQGPRSFGHGNAFHRLHIHGDMAARLSTDIWGLQARTGLRGPQSWFADESFVYVKVGKVTHGNRASTVINMTVSGDHTYLVCGLSTRNSWLVYNYQIDFTLAGAPERVMSINQHYELLERIKLVALGVSKSFVSGETSYSSAASGLTVFLQRLKALRDFFVNEWIIPKFFLPVAIVNGWVKPDKASKGQMRVKRSSTENYDEERYIIPTIEWEKSLDPNIDKERIDAMDALENNLRIKISDQRKYAAMGFDAEEEQERIVMETKRKWDRAGDDPRLQQALGLVAGGEDGAGGGGGALMPGIPPTGGDMGGAPGEEGAPPPGGEAPPPGGDMGAPPPGPEGASLTGDKGSAPKPGGGSQSSMTHWSNDTLEPLVRLFKEFDASELDDEPWVHALKSEDVRNAITAQDPTELWLALESWLIDENYPTIAIREVEDTLTGRKLVRSSALLEGSKLDGTLAKLGIAADDSDALFLVREPDKAR